MTCFKSVIVFVHKCIFNVWGETEMRWPLKSIRFLLSEHSSKYSAYRRVITCSVLNFYWTGIVFTPERTTSHVALDSFILKEEGLKAWFYYNYRILNDYFKNYFYSRAAALFITPNDKTFKFTREEQNSRSLCPSLLFTDFSSCNEVRIINMGV